MNDQNFAQRVLSRLGAMGAAEVTLMVDGLQYPLSVLRRMHAAGELPTLDGLPAYTPIPSNIKALFSDMHIAPLALELMQRIDAGERVFGLTDTGVMNDTAPTVEIRTPPGYLITLLRITWESVIGEVSRGYNPDGWE